MADIYHSRIATINHHSKDVKYHSRMITIRNMLVISSEISINAPEEEKQHTFELFNPLPEKNLYETLKRPNYSKHSRNLSKCLKCFVFQKQNHFDINASHEHWDDPLEE